MNESGSWFWQCSVNALLLSSPCFVPSASLTKWKKRAPPPVDLSILLLRQLDRFHVRRVCGCHPEHLILSGTRCLGQVLILSQVELLSERAHIKDSPQKDWKHIQIQHPLLDCRGNSHKQICIWAKKRIHWGAELFKLQKQRSKQERGLLKTKPKIESEALVPGSNLTVGSCYITACAFQINIWVTLSSSTAVFPEANVKLGYKVKLLHSPSALRPNYPLWLQLEARVFLAAVSVNELKGFSHLSHRALQLPAVSIAWVTTVGATQQTNNRNCQDILRWHITVRKLFFPLFKRANSSAKLNFMWKNYSNRI